MKTTELFAELLVIGAGSFSACLLALATIHPDIVSIVDSGTPLSVITALALLYLLGILTDRFADGVFDRLSNRRRGSSAAEVDAWKIERDKVFENQPFWSARSIYAKSRIRVVRGWALNSIFLAISSAVFMAKGSCDICTKESAIVVGVVFTLLCVSCVWAWRKMDLEEVALVERLSCKSQEDS